MAAPRAFISYAHDDEAHRQSVYEFWVFLRAMGIDARLDMQAAQSPQDWPLWMEEQVTGSDFVLLIASPEFRKRAGIDAAPQVGRGVQWEARLVREAYYRDVQAGRGRFLPVVLPGRSADELPLWLGPTSQSHYIVKGFSAAGAEDLLRYLTGQPRPTPPLGALPVFDSGLVAAPPGGLAQGSGRSADPLPTRVEVHVDDGGTVRTLVDGVLSGEKSWVQPPSTREPWSMLPPAPLAAGERLRTTGLELTRALFTEDTLSQLRSLLERGLPEQGVDVVLCGRAEDLQSVPFELLRLPDATLPLALEPGVTLARRIVESPRATPVSFAGPLKVLAAVAAPDETKTLNQPLDVEAEMQALLDATSAVADSGQLVILEVASPESIQGAIGDDQFHILHLSAHGSAHQLVLEDEDGRPHLVTARDLVDALRSERTTVPLIVLSACSHPSPEGVGLPGALLAGGADRVLAMQASVSDTYATLMLSELYRRLSAHPTASVASALASARQSTEKTLARRAARGGAAQALPEWGVATLWCATEDAPLVDAQVPARPLQHPPTFPRGGQVRELSLGELIGRRDVMRDALGVLRRRDDSLARFGAAGGVVLEGIGGIGKTAIAGRIMHRLRDERWTTVVQEGPWNPEALLADVARAW